MKLLYTLLALTLLSINGFGQITKTRTEPIRMDWDANVDGVDGYYLCYKIEGGQYAQIGQETQTGSNCVTKSGQSTVSHTFPAGTFPLGKHFAILRAFRTISTVTHVSVDSNEIDFTIVPTPPKNFRFGTVVASATTATTAEIAWYIIDADTLDKVPTKGDLYFGRTPDPTTYRLVNSELTTDHQIRLTNLTSKTLYYYKVMSVGEDGTTSEGTGTFRTK